MFERCDFAHSRAVSTEFAGVFLSACKVATTSVYLRPGLRDAFALALSDGAQCAGAGGSMFFDRLILYFYDYEYCGTSTVTTTAARTRLVL